MLLKLLERKDDGKRPSREGLKRPQEEAGEELARPVSRHPIRSTKS